MSTYACTGQNLVKYVLITYKASFRIKKNTGREVIQKKILHVPVKKKHVKMKNNLTSVAMETRVKIRGKSILKSNPCLMHN